MNMAPITTPSPGLPAPSPNSLKRSLSPLDSLAHPAKRFRHSYQNHHALHYPLVSLPDAEPAFTDEDIVDGLLERSIGLVFNHIGAEAADSVTLESFRHDVEEYMLDFLSYVRRSMVACRRTQPTPIDFEFAVRGTNLSLSSLIPHLKPPVNAYGPQLELAPAPPAEMQLSQVFLGDELSGIADRTLSPFIPSHFPPFPSRHTYRDSAVYTEREKDPRKVRELATEEGRMGEAALRKLAGAMRSEPLVDAKGKGKTRPQETMDSFFEKTVRSIVGDGNSFEFGPIVNCDQVHWRKDGFVRGPPGRRKGTTETKEDTIMVSDS